MLRMVVVCESKVMKSLVYYFLYMFVYLYTHTHPHFLYLKKVKLRAFPSLLQYKLIIKIEN